MKILLVSQYFWPESFVINDLVKCLVARANTVTVLTGKPNYPNGHIFEGYTAKGCVTEYFTEQIVVHRVPMVARGKDNLIKLLLNYFTFVFNGVRYFHRHVKNDKFDLIFFYSLSPITSVIPAIYLKKRLKIPLVMWLQDLWPESVRATGYIQNTLILKTIGALVR